jgi:hypothetical protein
MRLQPLSPDELAFLTAPREADSFSVRLCRKLGATLAARLRVPLTLAAQPAEAVGRVAAPAWQADAALATLWLTRRLGGGRVSGTAPFVPRSLIETLDATLAEIWLDAGGRVSTSPALHLDVTTQAFCASLVLQLPHDANDMTRWARGVIRHG